MVIGDWGLGIRIEDWDWGLGIRMVIGDWNGELGIEI